MSATPVITVRGQTISGSGDRSMALEQAASHRHRGLCLAEELQRWHQHLPDLDAVRVATNARIAEHFAAEREYRDAVRAFDERDERREYSPVNGVMQ